VPGPGPSYDGRAYHYAGITEALQASFYGDKGSLIGCVVRGFTGMACYGLAVSTILPAVSRDSLITNTTMTAANITLSAIVLFQ